MSDDDGWNVDPEDLTRELTDNEKIGLIIDGSRRPPKPRKRTLQEKEADGLRAFIAAEQMLKERN